jgi:hypothetical protein
MKRFSVGTNSTGAGKGINSKKLDLNEDLGLNGESVQIKDTMLKAVNFESVFDRFKEKIEASQNATRLLFR